MEHLTLYIVLSDENAWALAQFVKRVGFSDCRPLAVSEEEAWQMIHAAEILRCALAEAGYTPR